MFQGSSDIHCIGEDDPGVFGESHVVQTGGKILFLILLHPTNQAFSTKHTRLENRRVNNVAAYFLAACALLKMPDLWDVKAGLEIDACPHARGS